MPGEQRLMFPYLDDETQGQQQYLSHSSMNKLKLCQVEDLFLSIV
jgi:hypothetical protein